jgi:chemotaxis protein MotA
MIKIIGIIVVFASVIGGYVLSHGKVAALFQPFEVLIIGGASLGAFLQANTASTFMHVFKKSLKMFSSRFTHTFYLEVLKMLYEILNKSRREGMMAIEADVEDPAASPIFSKYPGILKDAGMTAFVCDYLRIMSSGNMAPHEQLFVIRPDGSMSASFDNEKDAAGGVIRIALGGQTNSHN